MRTRATIAAALGVLAAAALAVPAVAGGGAKTKVSIEAQSGGFFGFVESKKEKCANGRKVKLYKQLGSSQDPKHDEKVGTDIAQANGDGFMWAINVDAGGKYYAKTGKSSGCKNGSSPTIKAQK